MTANNNSPFYLGQYYTQVSCLSFSSDYISRRDNVCVPSAMGGRRRRLTVPSYPKVLYLLSARRLAQLAR